MIRDKEQLKHIMDTYGDYLKITAFHILHDHQLAEDMVQETFISFFTKNQFYGKSSVKTYLYSILLNHIKMYMRKKKPVVVEEIQYTSQMTINLENRTINKMDLSYAIKTLDYKYQQPLILYYFVDLSIKEIAKITCCTNSTVKMRLKRGREALREKLGEGYEKSIS